MSSYILGEETSSTNQLADLISVDEMMNLITEKLEKYQDNNIA